MSRGSRRSGFTLVEVIVAVALTGIVAAGAHRVVGDLIEANDRVRRHRAELDAEANARVWLGAAARSLDVQRAGFEGGVDSMRFVTWLPSSGGWLEPQLVQVGVGRDTLWLIGDSLRIPLRAGITEVVFDYLLEPGLDAVFVRNWSSPVSAPMAVRLRITAAGRVPEVDTILLLVGDRG